MRSIEWRWVSMGPVSWRAHVFLLELRWRRRWSVIITVVRGAVEIRGWGPMMSLAVMRPIKVWGRRPVVTFLKVWRWRCVVTFLIVRLPKVRSVSFVVMRTVKLGP